MIRSISILSFLFLYSSGFAQTAVYMDETSFTAEMIYKVENGVVYRYQNRVIRSPYLFIEGNKVYFNSRKFSDDIKYTLGEGVIYRGMSSEVLFTVESGKVYQGDSTYDSDVLYTFKDGVIYKGNSTSTFDAMMSYTLNEQDDLLLVVMLVLPY